MFLPGVNCLTRASRAARGSSGGLHGCGRHAAPASQTEAAKASAAFGSLPFEGGTKASDTWANLRPPNRQASIPSSKAFRSSSARRDGQPLMATAGQGFTFSVLPIARPSRNSRRRNSWRTRDENGIAFTHSVPSCSNSGTGTPRSSATSIPPKPAAVPTSSISAMPPKPSRPANARLR